MYTFTLLRNRYFYSIFVFLLMFSSSVFSRYGSLSMEDLDKGGGTFSMISHEGQNVLNMHIEKEIIFNEITLGGGLNIVFPERERPQGLSLIELKYINYDNGIWGISFGRIKGETYGYGLIMDGYDSSPASTYFNMSRAGVSGYTKTWPPFAVNAMYVGTGIAGVRFTHEFNSNKQPVIAGVSYILDSDGVVDSNSTIINKGAYGYSVDLGFKLVEPFIDAYVEYGALSNQSSAFTLGTKVDAGKIFDFRAEYRVLGENFMPSFFNSNYEIAPRNITATASATTGYFVGTEVRLLPLGILSVGLEDYANREPMFRAAIAFNEINGVSGVISYEKILQKDIPYKTSGVIAYPLNAVTNLVIYYEQVGSNEPSYTMAYKMKF